MNSDEIPGYCLGYPWYPIVESLPQKGTLLEAGSGCGLSACKFAEYFKLTNREYTIHTIDVFQGLFGVLDNIKVSSAEQLEWVERVCTEWDNITYSVGNFFKKEFPIPTVFFYDAEHSYDATLKALRKMQEAEVILVDDYTQAFPHVIRAVDLFAAEAEKELTVFNSDYMGCAMLR